jgi:hypothetical protein
VEVLQATLEAVAEELTIQAVDQTFLVETVVVETAVLDRTLLMLEQMDKAAEAAEAPAADLTEMVHLEETV